MMFASLGDSAVVVTLGAGIDEPTLARVRALAAALEQDCPPGIVDIVPAYATVTVFYDVEAWGGASVTPYERVCRLIAERAEKLASRWPELLRLGKAGADVAAAVEIPVCYGGEFGPDLAEVAQHCKLAPEAVVSQHAGADYFVQAVGFAPGFCYLGGLPVTLRTPRRPSPRLAVPAGSVGIGWEQTGVYPLTSPGGWQIIGRTPLAMFRVDRTPPALVRVGDRVKFRAISPEEFAAWK